jgi:hypothetical protein
MCFFVFALFAATLFGLSVSLPVGLAGRGSDSSISFRVCPISRCAGFLHLLEAECFACLAAHGVLTDLGDGKL